VTPRQDVRATTVQEDHWKRGPAYADLLAALAEYGYPSYDEARQARGVARTDAERQRYHDFENRGTALMCERVGVAARARRLARGEYP
jgi:hypothetical protein